MPNTDPRRRRRSRCTRKTGDPAGRIARPGPRRGTGPGHRDLAQSRRDPARAAARRARLAAGLGFCRRRRARGGGRQRPETRRPGRRHPAVGRLGRAGQLPQPCGRGAARRMQRRAGRDTAGGRPDRAARAAPGRAAARPQGAGGRRLGGVGHLACQLANAAGAQVWGHVRRAEYRDAVAGWCDGRVVLGPDLSAAKPHGPFWLIVDSVGASASAPRSACWRRTAPA